MSWPSLDPQYVGGFLLPPRYIPTTNDLIHQHDETLDRAYRYCAQLTQYHSKSFFFSTQLLPPAKREAIRVLYAFCRTSDDLVDLCPDQPEARLHMWRNTLRQTPHADDPVVQAWANVRKRYQLVQQLEDDLLAGVEMDVSINRYETFDDLWLYCYRVAAVVGLLSMQIIGYDEGAVPYAIKVGVALQLTNILRDVGEDAQRNRIYLPLEDLARFKVREQEILDGQQSERMRALLQFQIERAHRLYDESWQGIGLLHPDSRFAVATAATVYRGILDRIVQNKYDVWNQRARLSLGAKLRLLPAVFWRVRALNRQFPAAQWGVV